MCFKKVISLSLLFFFCSCQKALMENNQALEALEKKDLNLSYHHFLKAFSEDSFHPLIRYNFISYLVSSKNYDQAIEESFRLEKSLPLKDPLRFKTLFNLALIYTLKKETKKALEIYQRALEMKVESHKVRTNIEFLFKKTKDQKKDQEKKDNQKEAPKEEGQKNKKTQNSSNEKEQRGKEAKDQEGRGENQEGEKKDQKKLKNLEKKPQKLQNVKKQYIDQFLDELKMRENKIRMRKYQKANKGSLDAKDW